MIWDFLLTLVYVLLFSKPNAEFNLQFKKEKRHFNSDWNKNIHWNFS